MEHQPSTAEYIPSGLMWRIVNAGFQPAVQTLAMQLLLHTPANSNTVCLTKEEFMALSGDTSWNTARMRLTPLRASRLGHITTNEHVYITWWDENGQLHSPFPGASSSMIAPQSSVIGHQSSMIGVQSPVIGIPITHDWDPNHLPHIDLSIYQSIDTDRNDGVDMARSLKLLTDPEVGFSPTDAKNLVMGEDGRTHCFEWLERQVFTWLRQERKYGIGGLRHRIQSRWSASPLTWMDQESALYRRIHPEKFALESAQQGDTTQPTEPSLQPELQPEPAQPALQTNLDENPDPNLDLTLGETWPQVLNELAATVPPSTYNTWVKDMQPLSLENDSLIVGVANSYTLKWLEARLQPTIRRITSKIFGQSIKISFQVHATGAR